MCYNSAPRRFIAPKLPIALAQNVQPDTRGSWVCDLNSPFQTPSYFSFFLHIASYLAAGTAPYFSGVFQPMLSSCFSHQEYLSPFHTSESYQKTQLCYHLQKTLKGFSKWFLCLYLKPPNFWSVLSDFLVIKLVVTYITLLALYTH